MHTKSLPFLGSLAVVALAACSSTSAPTPTFPSALVTFAFTGIPGDTMRVFITDSATIVAAERYVATKSGPHLATGTIVRQASVDVRYPYQYQPETVRLVDAAIELCDGAPMHSAAAVDDFIEGATGNRNATTATWCPWASYPIAVQRLLPD